MLTTERYDQRSITLDDELDTVIDNVLDVPIDKAIGSFIDAASGARDDTTRPSGFFITQRDFAKVKAFTQHVYKLPDTLEKVRKDLGYHQSSVPLLEPGNLLQLYKRAIGLADFWIETEPLMKEVAAELAVFSVDLKTYGEAIISFIKSLSGYQNYFGEVGHVGADQLPDIKLNDQDRTSIPGLLGLSNELLTIVQGYKRKATHVKKRIEYFLEDLTELKDDISSASHALTNNNLGDKYADQLKTLQRLSEEIEELRRTYETYTKYKWVGAWWGPVGLIVSASIYGPKAGTIRDQIDDALNKKDHLEGELKHLDNVSGSLASFHTRLQLFETLSLEAINGAKNIEDIWLLINSYILASMSQMEKNSSATKLLIFETRLSSMIKHWEQISDEAKKVFTPSEEHYAD